MDILDWLKPCDDRHAYNELALLHLDALSYVGGSFEG